MSLGVQELQQRYGHPAGGVQGAPGLAEGEGLGQGAQHGGGLGVGAGQQHDPLGDPQQRPGAHGGGQRPVVQAQFGEPPGLGRAERRPVQVLAYGVHGRGRAGRELSDANNLP